MSYKIEQIEGIGVHYAERLASAGISSTDDLLSKCAATEGRERVSATTGISADLLATWYHQADLMRVSGIGSEFGQLLERAGVQSVQELAQRDPENIAHLLHRVNDMKRLTRAVPSMKTVSKWIARAQHLESVRGDGTADRSATREANRTPSSTANGMSGHSVAVPSLADTTRFPAMTSTPVVNGTGSRPTHPGGSWR